jgi:hypothetical protein
MLRMRVTSTDTEYFSTQLLYMKGVAFTKILRCTNVRNLGSYFDNVNNKWLRKIKTIWIGRI